MHGQQGIFPVAIYDVQGASAISSDSFKDDSRDCCRAGTPLYHLPPLHLHVNMLLQCMHAAQYAHVCWYSTCTSQVLIHMHCKELVPKQCA